MALSFQRLALWMCLTCDVCSHSEGREGDWQGALNSFKRDGWWIEQHGSKWRHYCPACAQERQDERRSERGIFD